MEKTKIKAIIFDYGGVISEPQNPDNVDNMLKIIDQDHHEFMEIYLNNRSGYDSGELSGREYWSIILQQCGHINTEFLIDTLIHEDVESWTQINNSMIAFIEESRRKVLKVAMISNMTRDTLSFMKEHFDWLGSFDELIFSCEIGINKPDSRIYDICLRKIGISPQECLFIDDSLQNVEGAMASGMKAIHFRNYELFERAFDQNYYLSQL